MNLRLCVVFLRSRVVKNRQIYIFRTRVSHRLHMFIVICILALFQLQLDFGRKYKEGAYFVTEIRKLIRRRSSSQEY